MATVLGLDPGLNLTGYAVLREQPGTPAIIEAGVIRVVGSTLANRVHYLHQNITEIIQEFHPDCMAVEELYSHYDRPKTAILMGHGRGVLFLAAAQSKIPVTSYLPTRVKKTVTGSGRATKSQMQLAIQTQFQLAHPPDPPDIADALAVALCHVVRLKQAG